MGPTWWQQRIQVILDRGSTLIVSHLWGCILSCDKQQPRKQKVIWNHIPAWLYTFTLQELGMWRVWSFLDPAPPKTIHIKILYCHHRMGLWYEHQAEEICSHYRLHIQFMPCAPLLFGSPLGESDRNGLFCLQVCPCFLVSFFALDHYCLLHPYL